MFIPTQKHKSTLSLTTLLTSGLLLTAFTHSQADIYVPPTRDACGTYAAKAVYQFRSQRLARCNFSGARWSEDGAGQHRWCRTVRPAVTENETKARATQLMRCLNPHSTINVNDLHLSTPVLDREMERAAGRGALERMQQLIAAGANFADHKDDLMGNAIVSGSSRMVAFLKRYGIPLSQPGKNKLNTLMWKSDPKGLQTVENLLKQGLNPNYTDAMGNLPLADAITYGNEKMVALLLRYRANPNLDIKGGQCKTIMPLDLAIDKGHERIVNLLRRAGARSQAQCGG